MPTLKPRITVTLSRPVHETISRMAKLTGESKGAVIADLLESVHPPLMRTVALLEAASEAPSQVRQGLLETIVSLEASAQASADANVAQMDWLANALGASGGAERRGTPADGSAAKSKRASNPRRSNTGVRYPNPPKKGK